MSIADLNLASSLNIFAAPAPDLKLDSEAWQLKLLQLGLGRATLDNSELRSGTLLELLGNDRALNLELLSKLERLLNDELDPSHPLLAALRETGLWDSELGDIDLLLTLRTQLQDSLLLDR